MITKFQTLLAVALAATLVGSSLAGTIAIGALSHEVKTPSVDMQHELLAVPPAQEGVVFCEVLGVSDVFYGLPGDPSNSNYAIDVAGIVGASGPVIITDLGWDVTIETNGPSWLSEAVFAFTSDTDPDLVQPITITPGAGDDGPGTATYSSGGLVNLVGNGLENIVAVDGIVGLELFDTFEDFADSPDANLLTGSVLTLAVTNALTFESSLVELKWVPEPASFGLLGLAGLLLIATRRKS